MNYKIFPFNFEEIDNNILIVSLVGDFIFLKKDEFKDLIEYKLDKNSDVYLLLKSKKFITDSKEGLLNAIEMTATNYRSKKGFLQDFTSLHMMVITLRCNQTCKYCQVSSQEQDAKQYDMSVETAQKVVDFIFESPSKSIKIEFQGGESTLNWKAIKESVLYAIKKNEIFQKKLEFVICTNLTTNITQYIDFIKEHNIAISSSLDGDKIIHNQYRVFKNGNGTYDKVIENIHLIRNVHNYENVDVLMTTTAFSLDKIKQIIDEYLKLNFSGIFLRAINPYGFAVQHKNDFLYDSENFVVFYKKALDYILELNKQGFYFVEYYTTLLLTRILTPFSTGFVDLQSPSGAGISGVIYDYDGNVYPADEARMLAKMGDKYFVMGNVNTHSYKEAFGSEILQKITNESCLEVMPICNQCVFNPYCGADPIRNYLETKDIMGDRLNSNFCKKNKAIFTHLFSLIRQDDEQTNDIFWSWINKKPLFLG